MTRKKSSPIAVDKNNQLYVKIKYSGIHPLVVLIDGLSLIHFGKEKTTYLKMEQAIEWHEKELRDSRGQSGSQKALDALREAKRRFENGEAEIAEAP